MTNNFLLGNVGTICLGTYNLSKNFLIHWSTILTGYLLHLKIFLRCSTSIWKLSILEKILKNQNRSVWTKSILQVSKIIIISKKNPNVASWKIEVTNRFFLQVILTSKKEKLFKMFSRFKQNKNIVNEKLFKS